MSETDIIIKWLMDNAYAAVGDDYWMFKDFPLDKNPDRFHIPIAPNTKIWRIIKARLKGEVADATT